MSLTRRPFKLPRFPTWRAPLHSGFAAAVVMIAAVASSACAAHPPLSNPHPSPEAVAVYDYLWSLRGQAILTGQQELSLPEPPAGDSKEIRYVQEVTGKLPALLGLDFMNYEGVTDRALDWWRRGGIPTICWHWGAPSQGTGYEKSRGRINVEEALTPGTRLNALMMADLDRTAKELVRLRDANVPVLWRPFHEMNGQWFWWGKCEPATFQKLWRLMYAYYTETYQLNNLIWVFGFAGRGDPAWYPGDRYVDIAGADTYSGGTRKEMYDSVAAAVGPDMLIAFHECGPIPDPAVLAKQGPAWSWFLTWHTRHLKEQNPAVYLKRLYREPYVVTLDEVPALTRRRPSLP